MKETGCMVFYYSSRESSIPVRDVRCNWDEGFKPEPNIETKTYGRFACCNCAARNTAKREFVKGKKYIFFLTNYQPYKSRLKQTGRQIIGYYKLDKAKRKKCSANRFETCWWWHAEEIKFYYPGLRLTNEHGLAKPERFNIDWHRTLANFWGPCRGFWKLDSHQVDSLLEWFKSRPKEQKITRNLWRKEVERLENINIREYGFAYPNLNRRKGFFGETVCR